MFTIFIICLLNPMISTKLLLLESEDKGTKKALKMEPVDDKDYQNLIIPGTKRSSRSGSGFDCDYNCNGWPYNRCRSVQYTYDDFSQRQSSAICIPPFADREETRMYQNYPECSSQLSSCERCDDHCAKEAGKRNRNDYKAQIPEPEGEDIYIEEISDGYCKYTCQDWPYALCQMERGGHSMSKCINPFPRRDEEAMYGNYPTCGRTPEGCKRCDDFCAKKDGKRDRNDYKKKIPEDRDGVYYHEVTDGYCKQICQGWPYQQCQTQLYTSSRRAGGACIPAKIRTSHGDMAPSNYPHCEGIPSQCKRCNRVCEEYEVKWHLGG